MYWADEPTVLGEENPPPPQTLADSNPQNAAFKIHKNNNWKHFTVQRDQDPQ